MLAQNLLLLIAANLVASIPAMDNSPKPINLEATELQRRSACAVAGVVNGQCGRYYRGTGCNDMINAIDPGVRPSLFSPSCPSNIRKLISLKTEMQRHLLLLGRCHRQHQSVR